MRNKFTPPYMVFLKKQDQFHSQYFLSYSRHSLGAVVPKLVLIGQLSPQILITIQTVFLISGFAVKSLVYKTCHNQIRIQIRY